MRESLRGYAEAVAEHLVIQWACRHEEVDRNLEILSKEIMPELRSQFD